MILVALPLEPTREQTDTGRPSSPIDIAVLTRAMLAADEQAYRQFHEVYLGRLARYLIVVTSGNEHRMRDALQETFRRVAKHVRVFEREDVFWSWLTEIARSAAIDQQRSTRRYWAILERFSRDPGHNHRVNEDHTRVLQELLAKNVAELTAEERALIEAKYFERQPTKDIARNWQTTEGAIESRLVRIRQKLKAALLSDLKNESR